jgi:hypothetical protein
MIAVVQLCVHNPGLYNSVCHNSGERSERYCNLPAKRPPQAARHYHRSNPLKSLRFLCGGGGPLGGGLEVCWLAAIRPQNRHPRSKSKW